MALAILVILLAIGIGVAVGMKQVKASNQLMDEGRVVRRTNNWLKSAEEFTLTGGDFARVVQGVQAADLSGTGLNATKSDAEQAVGFKSSTWSAILSKEDDAGDKNVYDFHFVAWHEHNGVPQDALAMNVLLTAVEKLFLAIDPNTQVRTTPIKVKTKTDFF